MENNLQWKTTSNIKSDIPQQPLARSLQNFQLKLMLPNQTSQMFQMMTPPAMEDELNFFSKWKTTSIRGRLRGKLECVSAQPSLSCYSLLFICAFPLTRLQHNLLFGSCEERLLYST